MGRFGREARTFESMLSVMSDPDARRNCSRCAKRCAPGASTITFAPTPTHRAPHADRHAYAGAGARRPRSRGGAADHSEIGDRPALDAAVEDAFPGARVDIDTAADSSPCCFTQHGLLRPLSAAELSDGTLRYLLWIARAAHAAPAVADDPQRTRDQPASGLAPRAGAAHREGLGAHAGVGGVACLAHDRLAQEAKHCNAITLTKELGETAIEGQGMLDAPPWKWPER
jgi:hypothetical protein